MCLVWYCGEQLDLPLIHAIVNSWENRTLQPKWQSVAWNIHEKFRRSLIYWWDHSSTVRTNESVLFLSPTSTHLLDPSDSFNKNYEICISCVNKKGINRKGEDVSFATYRSNSRRLLNPGNDYFWNFLFAKCRIHVRSMTRLPFWLWSKSSYFLWSTEWKKWLFWKDLRLLSLWWHYRRFQGPFMTYLLILHRFQIFLFYIVK